MILREFEAERGLVTRDIVQAMREEGFTGYDKSLHCKVKNPERYGVRLIDEAEEALMERYPGMPEVRGERLKKGAKKDFHRLKDRVYCRLDKGRYALLQQAIERKGFSSMQSGLTHIINCWLEGVVRS